MTVNVIYDEDLRIITSLQVSGDGQPLENIDLRRIRFTRIELAIQAGNPSRTFTGEPWIRDAA